jgi:hypothetical protein
VVVCILAVTALVCLVVVVSHLLKRNDDAYTLLRRTHDQFLKGQERVLELVEVDYVAKHLRRYGVGGYLLMTANDRMAEDVQAIMQYLGMNEAEAIEYLKTGVRSGIESREQERNGRPVPGDARSQPGDG